MFTGADVESILSKLPVALITTDANRRIVNANQAALKLFGYESEQLVGQEIECLIPPRFAKDHPRHYRNFAHRPASRPMGLGRDLAGLKKDGTEFPVEVGLTVLPTNPPLYLASIIDLTLRMQTESLLRERQDVLETNLEAARLELEEQVSEKTRLEERQRLGRELHDSLSQNLYGIGLGLRTSLAKVKKEDDPTKALEYCLNLTEASLVEMRALLFKLRPKSLENVPLGDVLSSHCSAVSSRTNIPIAFSQIGEPKADVPFETKYALYRIITESLHNCMKHAEARNVEMTLQYGRTNIEVVLSDDGKGFDTSATTTGHGMATMNERASAVGGLFEVSSGGDGTTIKASVPWTRQT